MRCLVARQREAKQRAKGKREMITAGLSVE
jgi:hypothetical protein